MQPESARCVPGDKEDLYAESSALLEICLNFQRIAYRTANVVSDRYNSCSHLLVVCFDIGDITGDSVTLEPVALGDADLDQRQPRIEEADERRNVERNLRNDVVAAPILMDRNLDQRGNKLIHAEARSAECRDPKRRLIEADHEAANTDCISAAEAVPS